MGKLRAGPGGQRPGISSSAPSPSKKWQFLESVNLFPAVVAKKGKKKSCFKETHNNFRKPREHDGCVHSPEYSAEARGPFVTRGLEPLEVSRAGQGPRWGLALFPGANARLPGRQRLFSLPFPGIMALDINDSR